jgi:DNA-binding response OmpR family regulator
MTEPERVSKPAEAAQQGRSPSLRHELRTPLNAIIGYSEMLLEDARDEGLEGLIRDLSTIRTAGRQLVMLVDEILDPAPFDRSDLGHETIRARLSFELRTPLNAVLGYTEMLLEDAEDEGKEDWLPDLRNIHAAATRFLALLDDIVDPAGITAGALGAEPETATPSSTVQERLDTARPLPQDSASLAPVERGYLLLVDDDPMNRDTLSRHLQRQGHQVAVAENGRQALKMVSRLPFDLVLLDVMMPEMDGYEVLQRLKRDKASRDIPVIVISALDEIESAVLCIEMGAADYLPKPFSPVLLRARIGACLEQKRLRDQEVEYLRNVARVTAAAAAVEGGEFEPDSLADVASRTDGLGQLARVFQRMAREVYAREERLKEQVRALCIELSQGRQARRVAEITETEYFQRLQAEADELRDILEGLCD